MPREHRTMLSMFLHNMHYVYEFEAWGERELVEFLHDRLGEDIDTLQACGFTELVGMAYEAQYHLAAA